MCVVNAWLGLGSNQGQPEIQLSEALHRLADIHRLDILRTSSFYRTPPWGDEEQDDFINAVVEIETSLDPPALLQAILSIERMMGRQRNGRRWGPRRIDIDLLLYGDLRYRSDDLVIPHPRMHQRAFVLIPLSELDRTLEIPSLGNVEKLLQNLDRNGIERLRNPTRP